MAYEPTELVVTARCGTPLARLEEILAEKGQSLAFEPPHFGAGATVGGCVASGLADPRRAQAGAVRDFVLGVKILNGQGELLNFGGQVMKNVAGYDVSRLMAGSLGTLGLIAEVSLKVLPVAVAEQTVCFELTQDKALDLLNRWGGQPLPVSASAWSEDVLHVRLSGAAAAVSAASRTLGGQRVDHEDAYVFWRGIREQQHVFFAGEVPLWRISVPSTSAVLALPGAQLIEWGGALRWMRGPDAVADRAVRRAAEQGGGHATLFRAEQTLKAVEEAVLPEVNADFAKSLGVADGDVAKLREEGRVRRIPAAFRAFGANSPSTETRLRPAGNIQSRPHVSRILILSDHANKSCRLYQGYSGGP